MIGTQWQCLTGTDPSAVWTVISLNGGVVTLEKAGPMWCSVRAERMHGGSWQRVGYKLKDL